jgi:hypothetical protein
MKYQDYLAGRYKPQGGRPRQRCGSAVCDRKAKTAKQKQQRLQKRREKLAAEADEGMAEFYAMPVPELKTGFVPITLEDVPEEHREAVRAKLESKRENFDFHEPRAWNQTRGRNEPSWPLSHQLHKRGG